MPPQVTTIYRREFGQEQPLTVALHKLVRDYPLGVGLFKEFIQNADDAGATEIRFILDRGSHPTDRLLNPNLARLNGPSLVVWNDATFNEEDLLNIQSLGDSRKAEAPAKIGRFGLGFNSCYNVTDYPQLLTGKSVYLFDPHRTAEDYGGLTRPGVCWDLTDALWANSPDLISPFHVAGLRPNECDFKNTAFRLPLRDAGHVAVNGRIRAEVCSPDTIRSLMGDFAVFAPSVLLFLKSIVKVSFHETSATAAVPTEFLSIKTTNTDQVVSARRRTFSLLQGDFDEVLQKLATASEEDLRSVYNHHVQVCTHNSPATHDWIVLSGLFRGPSNRLLTLAQDMWKRGEKAIPLAGIAARVPQPAESVQSKTSGEVFCFLPLPDARGAATIPVHINGFFDVSASRRTLTHEAGAHGTVESLRGQWNRALIEDGVSTAYCELLQAILQEHPAMQAESFYQLWLDPSTPMPDPLAALTPAFYKQCAERPLLRSADASWVPPKELRQVDTSIREALLAEKSSRLPDPEIPSHVIQGFSAIDHAIAKMSPSELRDLYRLEKDADCDLSAVPRPSLSTREFLGALTRFAFKDLKQQKPEEVPKQFTGLPFLLTADARLHCFGLHPPTVFLATKQERRIFQPFPLWFVDEEHARHSILAEMPSLRISRMSPATLLTNLKSISPPESARNFRAWIPASEAPPNENWLIEVLTYLSQQPAIWKADRVALSTCCLVPDQFARVWPCCDPSTPLLPMQQPSDALLHALTMFRVGIVSGSSELLSQFAALQNRYPNQLTRPLSAISVLDALLVYATDFVTGNAKPGAIECEVILAFLSSAEALEAYQKQQPPSLNSLKALPIFPTEGGELVALSAQQCYLPSQVQAPQVRLPTKLLKRGSWSALLKSLGVGELTARALIEKVLLPGYSQLSVPDQFIVLSWVRDHVDQALTEAGQEEAAFLETLRKAPIVRCSGGDLHSCASLYFPGDQLVKEVLGEKALFPHMALYTEDRDRWLGFFGRLGMSRSPRPQDLAEYILFLVQRLSLGADYQETAIKLTLAFQHLVDYWHTLENATVKVEGGTTPLRDFLRNLQWCPPLRGPNNLRHLLVAEEPEKRLYYLRELSPPSLGHLVGGVLPLMPLRQRDGVPDGVRKLVPEVAEPNPDQVVAHFIKIIDHINAAEALDEKTLRTPLKSVYIYFGTLLGPQPQSPEDLNEQDAAAPPRGFTTGVPNPAVAEIRRKLQDRATIFVPKARCLRRPQEVFRRLPAFLQPWWAQVSFTEAKVDGGLLVLGRKDDPDFQDLCALTVTLHGMSGTKLEEPHASCFLSVLGQIESLWPKAGPVSTFFIMDREGRTALPTEVYFNDADWLPESLDLSVIKTAHPSTPRVLVHRAGIRLMSQHLKRRPTGSWQDSEKPGFVHSCARYEELLHSQEFKKGLQRITANLHPDQKRPDLTWLDGLAIRAMAKITCEYYLADQDGEITVGEIEDAIFWHRDEGQPTLVYVAESAKDLLDVKLAETIKRELPEASVQDICLMKILSSKPEEIERLLDQLRVPKLLEQEGPVASKPQEPQADQFFDGTPQEPGPDKSQVEGAGPESEMTAGAAEPQAGNPPGKEGQPPPNGPNTPEAPKEATGEPPAGGQPTPTNKDSGAAKPVGSNQPGERRTTEPKQPETPTGQGGSTGQDSEPGWDRMPPGEGGRGATPQPKPRPRDRLISYVANDHTQAANKQDPTDDEIPLNKRIGDDAVGWVLQYERHQGRNPDPSNHIQNLAGFDVVSHKPGQKDPRFIEVKGTKGGWGNAGIPLSVRQFDFAKEKGHLFWLYVVEFADLPEEVTIYPIQNPVNRINQFRFDCGWKHLAQPDTQFRPVLPKPGLRIQLTKTQHPPRTGRIKSVKNYDGRYELQVAWADGPHGMVWFEPLTVQILPDTTLEASSL